MKKIVTRSSLVELLRNDNPEFVKAVIGKALVHLFRRQTEDEQIDTTTKHHNERGFAAADAYSGSLTAKYYLHHKTLKDWMVTEWTKDFRGNPRIAKYHRQLNEEAVAKNRR